MKNPADAHFQTHFASVDVEFLKKLGITHIRLPIDPFFLLDEKRPGTLKAPQLTLVDAAIDRCASRDLAVIVDLHAERIEEFSRRVETEPAFADAFVSFWGALAKHLARTDPERVFLEVMNEPVFVSWQPKYDPKSAQWDEIQGRAVAAIRAAAPRHTIIVGGVQWSSIDGLKLLKPLADKNLVYNFHFYEPHAFTHQAATWGDRRWRHLAGLPYPSSVESVAPQLAQIRDPSARKLAEDYGKERWDAPRMEKRLDQAAEWARRHGVRLTCNEFGAYRPKTPAEARVRWLRDVRTALEKRGIGWTMWEYAGGFGLNLRDVGKPPLADAAVADALGLQHAAPDKTPR
jgi:aryl-phospho-beta-D-glucosidase BglC (GH1 family)